MPAGFQSINTSGTVQIDETYQTLHLISAPTITINQVWDDTHHGLWATYDVAGVNPMVVIGNTSGQPVMLVSRVNIGTNLWRFTFSTTYMMGLSVKLYFFHGMSTPPAGTNFGLQVFSPTGALVFDSGTPFMHLANVYQVSGSGSSHSVPQDGRTYAAGLTFSRLSLHVISAGGGTGYTWDNKADGLSVSGTTVTASRERIYSFATDDGQNLPTERPPQTTNPPQILLVDVTHL